MTDADVRPLCKCRVLYLGTAVPESDKEGLDAIQEPLAKRYPTDGSNEIQGLDAWLTIYSNGVQLAFVQDTSTVLFFPVRTLIYCAAVRFATVNQNGSKYPKGWRFVPIDSYPADHPANAQNPPLFAGIFRRTKGLDVVECHSFVTKTKQAALALVQSCMFAYKSPNQEQDVTDAPFFFEQDDYGHKEHETELSNVHLVAAPLPKTAKSQAPPEFFERPPEDGFFYKTENAHISTWQLWEDQRGVRPRPPPSPKPHGGRRRKPPASNSSSSELDSGSHTDSSSSSSLPNNHRQRRDGRRDASNPASLWDPSVVAIRRVVDPRHPDKEVLLRFVQDAPPAPREVIVRDIKLRSPFPEGTSTQRSEAPVQLQGGPVRMDWRPPPPDRALEPPPTVAVDIWRPKQRRPWREPAPWDDPEPPRRPPPWDTLERRPPRGPMRGPPWRRGEPDFEPRTSREMFADGMPGRRW